MCVQSLCDRGLDGNLAFLQVSLALAHDGIGHLCLVSHVGHLYLRHDLHAVGAELLGVDDFSLGNGELQTIDLIF